MSFKSEAASVRAGLSSGSFMKKVDPFKGFFEELSYGLKKQDEEKRQEERVKRQEARAIGRATKAKQDAEDKLERDRESLANFYLTSTGASPTAQNRTSLMSVIKGGNFTDFGSLEDHMKQYSTYSEGTPQGDIDKQMQDVGVLQPGDGPFQAKTEEVSKLSPEGTIEFTGSKGKDVLSMALDEVRYELSDTSLTTERRSDLERRLKSLTDAKTYEPTTLFKSDGSEVVARTADEETAYLAAGFSPVKGAKPEEFVKRSVYKDGGEIEVFDQEEYTKLTKDGWSNVKPADATTFQKRTLYKDGTKLEVFNQEDLKLSIDAGWSAVEPAELTEFDNRFVYKDGGQIEVFDQEVYDELTKDGWSNVKPADATAFQKRTLYKEGEKLEVFSQDQLDESVTDGWSAIQPKTETAFESRIVYKDGAELKVFNIEEYDTAVADGWDAAKPAKVVDFKSRTLFKSGAKQFVTTQAEMDANITDGWSAIEPAAPTEFDNRYVYKDGGELQVFNQADYDAAITDGWGAAKPAKATDFKSRTLYNSDDGTEQVVQSQEEMDAATKAGFSPIKPAKDEDFNQRTLYSADGKEVVVFTKTDMDRFVSSGFSDVKPAKLVPYVPRTLYKGNQEVQVRSASEGVHYIYKGFSAVKINEDKYVARTYYKDGQEQKVIDAAQQAKLEADGWNGIKLDDISQIMSDLDVDRKTASQIENGVLKVSTDFAGRPIVIDISQTSSQAVAPEGQDTSEMPQETLDAVLSQFFPNWKENGLSIMVNGEQVSFTPAQVQNNESFKIQLEDLTGLEGAFGLGGAINKIIGKAGDIFGAELKSEQNKAITFMSNLRLNTLINLAAATAGGLRDSVWNKQQIIATIPEPARVFEGPIEARNKTRETLRSIQTSLKLLDQALASNTVAKAQISQSTITRASLRELEKTYLTVLEAFEGELGAVAPVPRSFIKPKSSTSGDTN